LSNDQGGVPLQLQPGLIFAIVTAAALLLIVGTGVAIAGGLYTLDRTVRRVKAATGTPFVTDSIPEQRQVKPTIELTPSPLTQMIAASGYTDVEPTLRVKHTKLGMWIFLASEVLFFTGLIGAFLFFRLNDKITAEEMHHFNEAVHIGSLSLPAWFSAVLLVSLNTFILLTSSFAVVLALDSLIEGKVKQTRVYLLGVFLLGAVFLSVQALEWQALGVDWGKLAIPFDTTFRTAFFTLTGFHGLHVFGGLIWLLVFLLPRALRGTLRPQNASDIEIFGLYWHFVDIVWIILFTLIYLLR
jgi:heme/copper-type cytochrome/quinol oxidase subunit 3